MQLYCCSSYYQLLIALIKSMTQRQRMDLVLEKHGIETADLLAKKLEDEMSDCVNRVFVCPDSAGVDPYVQRCSSFLPWQRRRIIRHMEQVLEITGQEFKAWKDRYERIHVFWDLGYAGTYLNIRKIHYTLHEDSLNSYQHIRENRQHYAYIFRKKGWVFRLKSKFHVGVIPFGYSDCCDRVEVNEKDGIDIPGDKVTEICRADLENHTALSGEKEAVLILTEPFAVTGRLSGEGAQVRIYRDVIARYAAGREVLIKPHPRDSLDYGLYFSRIKMIDKNIPMEVLNYDEEFHISLAVTITSSAVWGVRCADEKIYLGQDCLDNFKGRDRM